MFYKNSNLRVLARVQNKKLKDFIFQLNPTGFGGY